MKKNKIYLLGLFALFIGNCVPPTTIDDDMIPAKFVAKVIYDRTNEDIKLDRGTPSIDYDINNDGTEDWGNGMNLPSDKPPLDSDGLVDGDVTDDGSKDWGQGINIPSRTPIDADGQTDGDFTDDGTQDWGQGVDIPSRPPIDIDGITDGDLTDDGTQDWGQGININIDYDIDEDGTQDFGQGINIDKDINEDGTQDWGDGVNIGNNLDSDHNGYIDPVPLDPTFRDPNDPYQNWNLGKTGYIILKTDSLGVTYDFSGLGMDPNDYNQVTLISRYYYTNQLNARQHLNVTHTLATSVPSASTLWKGYYNGNYVYTYNDTDELKYIHTIPPDTPEWIFDPTPINAYCGEYTYYHEPLNGANGGNRTKYTFKGVNDGTGKVEIVGFIVFKNGIIVDQRGDNTQRPPYLPTGHGPPAIGE